MDLRQICRLNPIVTLIWGKVADKPSWLNADMFFSCNHGIWDGNAASESFGYWKSQMIWSVFSHSTVRERCKRCKQCKCCKKCGTWGLGQRSHFSEHLLDRSLLHCNCVLPEWLKPSWSLGKGLYQLQFIKGLCHNMGVPMLTHEINNYKPVDNCIQ